jgi:hypothetical protein
LLDLAEKVFLGKDAPKGEKAKVNFWGLGLTRYQKAEFLYWQD